MKYLFHVCLLVMCAIGANVSNAQVIPPGPVTMIVPFPAGGGTDALARNLADHLRVSMGRTIVVQNIGGGGGAIGLTRLAKAKPDGLTVAIGSTAGIVNVPLLKPTTTPYDALKSFVPIGQFTGVSHIFTVNKDKLPGVTNIGQLVAYLKQHPGEVSYGTPGVGTGQHFAVELFQQMTGTQLLHVPYSGSSQVLVDLVGGQIDMAVDTGAIILPQLKSGKLQTLAWTGRTRPDFDKSMPTVAETIPKYDRIGWHGLFAPAGTPAAVVEQYSNALRSFAQKPETAASFKELGVQVVFSTPQEFEDEIIRERERVGSIVRNSGKKFE